MLSRFVAIGLFLWVYTARPQLDLIVMFQGGECYDLTSKKPVEIQQE